MGDVLARLAAALSAAGGAHPLAVGVPAAAGLLWALYWWADEAAAPGARRLAGVAVGLLGLALLVRLGAALDGPRAWLTWWQAALGLVVLPLFVRSPRLGGAAAMLVFVCIAILLHAALQAVADVALAVGTALAGGASAFAAAATARRVAPAPAPTPVPPAQLQQRLDSDDAREGADKYTRE